MIRSMTGYGRSQGEANGREITVEIKCVNHRYFDFSARVPRSLSFLEEKLKSLVQEEIRRGKVELYLSVDFGETSNVNVELNRSLLANYLELFAEMEKEFSLTNDVTVASAARLPDVFNVKKPELDEEEIWRDVRKVAGQALLEFISMREKEGEKTLLDLKERVAEIKGAVLEIENRSPEIQNEYKERLEGKIREVVGTMGLDEGRILTEVAIFADKIAVSEELVRLKSHFSQMEEILLSEGAIGRKLDFLLQEMNREVNTVGSKNADVEIARHVVFIKSELEKIREQIQNIE